ncbi:MAG: tannase/feruloyl esterase family alpha/beta hydrolase [Acidobacteriaceae bacterium]|nr:tannase/feruloyl esterase family alpha/beta hydrolase [Acidobacteriaceae bacterium]
MACQISRWFERLPGMRRRFVLLVVAAGCLPATLATAQEPPQGKNCEGLAQTLTLPDGKITSAEVVAAGAFVQPNLRPDEKPWPGYKITPAFCRVRATLAPTPSSDIKVEVWMPVSGWNGKFRGVGNGGFAGYIGYQGLAESVRLGYASASTDTGHATTDAEWALGQPEKIVDYGYRAVHLMTADAKSVVQAFYGSAARLSYFAYCSNGGRQALMEAQRYPADYDGIIAGAPANNWTNMLTGGLHLLQVMDGPGYIPGAKTPAIAKAVNAACDAKDGTVDGVVDDPPACHFNPEVMLCKGAETDSCLTAPQIASLKAIYAGLKDPSGKLISPGIPPGAEDGPGGWGAWIFGKEEGKSIGAFFVTGDFSNMVYDAKDWNFRTANVESALKLADEKTGAVMNATDPNLKPFFARGGKLILYHGWNDPAISAYNSINYYNSVKQAVGANETDASMRLYMVPGMQHCAGGPGATSFGQDQAAVPHDAQHDIFAALVDWVEKGNAPSSLIASKMPENAASDPPPPGSLKPEMTRPLCPYPQEMKYSGKGDPHLASSFSCVGGK